MKDWISLFEKYRIDRRLYDLHRNERACLSPNSPRKPALEAEMARLEHSIYYTELLLSHYDAQVASRKDAVRRAEERLFLACHYIKGLSMEETAAEMCISRDTVYRVRRRIMERGDIPREIFDLCKFSQDENDNFGDSRLRVQDSLAVRDACFAGNSSVAFKSSVSHKQKDHPQFTFPAKQ